MLLLLKSRLVLAISFSLVVLTSAFAGWAVLTAILVMCWLTWSFHETLSRPAALPAAALVLMLGCAVVVTWSHLIPIDVSLLQMALLAGLVWFGAFVAPHDQRAVEKSGVRGLVSHRLDALAAFLPAVLTFTALLLGGNLFGQNLGWMLTGDAQNNTVAVREIVLHNGANPAFIPAPALAQLLMASGIAGQIGHALQSTDFVHMVQVQAVMLAALWSITSLVFGLVANREFQNRPVAVRVLTGFAGACFPLTWFVLGFSTEAGFYNTPLALMSLGMAWLFWRELAHLPRKSQWVGVSLLALTTLFAAMAWVPLALIPGLMFLVACVRIIRVDRDPKQLVKWQVFLSVGLLSVYSGAVILPSFLDHGEGLAGDGWMADLPKSTVIVTVLLALLVSGLVARRYSRRGNEAFGLLLIVLGIGLGLGFLMFSSLRNGLIWSYYPRKFAWMAVFFLMFVTAVVALASPAIEKVKPWWRGTIATGSVLGLLTVGLVTVPFSQTGPLKIFPLIYVAVHGQDVTGAVPAIAETVGTKTIRLNYDENDFIVNQWAFQWASQHNGTDSIWSYAYSLINSPADVCSAAQTWGGEVRLLTHSESTRNAVMEQCAMLISKVDGL